MYIIIIIIIIIIITIIIIINPMLSFTSRNWKQSKPAFQKRIE